MYRLAGNIVLLRVTVQEAPKFDPERDKLSSHGDERRPGILRGRCLCGIVFTGIAGVHDEGSSICFVTTLWPIGMIINVNRQ